jgi:Domain of unknown function (DUF4388)
MSDELSIQGTLAETTVPDLFRSLIRSGETAIVSIDAVGRNDVIYFSEGRIIYASSTDPDLGLGEILLRSGELNLQQYNNALDRIVVARRMGAVLVELGYLKPDELLRAVEQLANAIVLSAMSLRSGNYTIEFTSQWPEGIISLPLNTERLMLDGIRSIEYWSLILRGISRFERMLEAVPGAEMRSYALELNDDESHILSFFTQPQTIESVCSRSYLTNFVTCRTLWGLLAVNLLQDAETQVAHEKRAAVQTEYELEALVEKYNTIFQTIFGIVFQTIGDHIYDFIDRVVLHLSPGTLPYLSGMNLVNEARIDFDQLLNNMIASGATDHSTIVQNVLNELLAGWVFEVKSEFGGETEAVVMEVARSVKE